MPTLRNYHFADDKISRKRACTIINIIMFIRLFIGLYSEIKTSFTFKMTGAVYCICFAVFSTYVHILLIKANNLSDKDLIGFINRLVFYTIIVLVSLCSNGEHFYEYLEGLYQIDFASCLKVKKFDPLFSTSIFFVIVLGNICRFVNLIIIISANQYWLVIIIVFNAFLLLLAVHSNHMTRIIVFELLWNRMKVLRKTMESQLHFTPNIIDRDVKQHITKLEKYLNVYKMWLDNLRNVSHASKLLVSTTILSESRRRVCHNSWVVF